MEYFKRENIFGSYVDLSHLDPFEIICSPVGFPDPIRVKVVFSTHCFTNKYDNESGDQIYLYDEGNRPRSFCSDRYNLSVSYLKDTICQLSDAKVYQTHEGRNYLTYCAIPVSVDDDEYHVFFKVDKLNVKRAPKIQLFVESAYRNIANTWQTKQKGKVRFALLIGNVMKGKSIKFNTKR